MMYSLTEENMKEKGNTDRRSFLKVTGGAILAAGALSAPAHASERKAAGPGRGDPLGSATVSFGGWMTPLDRFTTLPPPSANHHEMIPNTAKIRAGGYVNFIISGLHVVAIYDDGYTPADIDTSVLVPGPRFGPPIINDSEGRIYRGIDPVIASGPPPVLNLDRVEVVHFEEPGMYLVICAVLPHFVEGMVGYVKVLQKDEDEDAG